MEEIAGIEIKAVLQKKVKGKLWIEPRDGFWEGKTPCWEMFRYPVEMRNECPAFKYWSRPCREMGSDWSKDEIDDP